MNDSLSRPYAKRPKWSGSRCRGCSTDPRIRCGYPLRTPEDRQTGRCRDCRERLAGTYHPDMTVFGVFRLAQAVAEQARRDGTPGALAWLRRPDPWWVPVIEAAIVNVKRSDPLTRAREA
mgnify:CR=1 FL=1